jgi:hypothetical protein
MDHNTRQAQGGIAFEPAFMLLPVLIVTAIWLLGFGTVFVGKWLLSGDLAYALTAVVAFVLLGGGGWVAARITSLAAQDAQRRVRRARRKQADRP